VNDLLSRVQATLGDRYRLERETGAGGMAVVFLATDLKHDRAVALKVLRPELSGAVGSDRFLREIEVAAQLSHPNILPLYDSGEASGMLYYVMPFVEGETLRDRLAREKQLSLDEALTITREIADALSYAHSRGIVHRDIKPENVLLQSGHAVVADFGIARALSTAGERALTATGLVVGTPQYMSPEQSTGMGDVDARSDIYSLGCVLYEMLSGEPPYRGPTAQAIIARRLSEPVPSLRAVRELLPEPVERAILRALARTPVDRFATAAQFASALVEAASLSTRSAAPARVPVRAIGLAAAAVAGVVAVWALARQLAQPGVPLSLTRVAVLPFSVHGSEHLAYLGEGMVDLLSRSLDGTEELRSVDPGTIFTTSLKHAGPGAPDAERARAIAGEAGAGLYVLGSVNAVSAQLRIQAQLYDQTAAPDAAALAQVTVEGDSTTLFELVDRLSAGLLVGRQRGPAQRLAETAAFTTRSLPALKTYLDAEHKLRLGQIDTAIALFRRAGTEDSTFALAYYRLAVAAGWSNRHDLAGAATRRALELSARLGGRDRRLLLAYDAFRRGAANEAEEQFRGILQDYPDDLEAEFQLADLLFHYNPLRARPMAEARDLFDRVFDVDPGFL
jgi:serine/threonine-protein kinase